MNIVLKGPHLIRLAVETITSEIHYVDVIQLLCLALLAIALFLGLNNRRHIKKTRIAQKNLSFLVSGEDLDTLLVNEQKTRSCLEKELTEHKERLAKLEIALRKTIGGIGFIRFNSLDSVGGDLSYALAMINHEGDGILLTNIYTLEESRGYAKKIVKGSCSNKISDEEKKAIAEALQGLEF